MTETYVMYADGASRGNPGPAAIGAVIYPPGADEPIAQVSEAIGETTNNRAEYLAVVAGLNLALELGVRDLLVRLDSQLLVRQVAGEYRVRSADLKPLHRRVVMLLGRFRSAAVEHVPRERNTVADALANAALDR